MKNPVVEFLNGEVLEIGPHEWVIEEDNYISNDDNHTIIKKTIKQIPLMLAWAVTVHKSQGASLDSVIVDIGDTIFECGQTYVALSRIKSLEGLYLTGFDYTKIKINRKVHTFYNH